MATTQRPFISLEAYKDERFAAVQNPAIQSILCFPISAQNRILAVLQVRLPCTYALAEYWKRGVAPLLLCAAERTRDANPEGRLCRRLFFCCFSRCIPKTIVTYVTLAGCTQRCGLCCTMQHNFGACQPISQELSDPECSGPYNLILFRVCGIFEPQLCILMTVIPRDALEGKGRDLRGGSIGG